MAFVNTVGDEELLERAQKALRPHGVHLGWAPDADEVLVSIDDAQTRLPATVSRGLRPAGVTLLARRVPEGSLIVTDRVTSGVREELRKHGLWHVDAAGNMSVRSRGVVIDIQGRVDNSSPRQPTSTFSRASWPVVLAVLTAPSLVTAPLRTVQEVAGVSLGTTQKVISRLRSRGLDSPPAPVSFHDPEMPPPWRALFDAWVTNYLEAQRPGTRKGVYRSDLDMRALRSTMERLPATVSGEPAAHLAGLDIKAAVFDIYVDDVGSTVRALRLRPDPDGAIRLRPPLWSASLETPLPHREPRLAPPAVVYADLLAIGDPRTDTLAQTWLQHEPTLRHSR
ncbi:MAG TPA: type IV toxin-antitoxin system AbiEi family antitoxin [Propioniciclava sp.]|jgi:hypothetical protein|uniref:type IV toxin-antitoxin system AbiEi family antitoxin n=1 Tax=Propioniciclava sp. TaxID=2038686 RepID=UPI002C7CBFDF|nr:type IV toxin-antitoxin system AbiEi family antitoxin [Propioniciclava sp.]HRL50309.1 type IV toxin-antitoxin system AbiEi family antitoxin [Propioniciclava sp.]HRL80031.1 type IV toxin-antitoxin system AbiEi family antitoxin [Propioniciclava sp.]